MEFASDVVSIEKNGGVGTLWLDRPEKYNAMNESNTKPNEQIIVQMIC